MHAPKSLPLLILSWHFLGAPGRAQSLETPTPPSYRFPSDAPAVHDDEKRCALDAARVDPDIVVFAVPPPGTRMPTIHPPDNLDPGLLFPRPSTGCVNRVSLRRSRDPE